MNAKTRGGQAFPDKGTSKYVRIGGPYSPSHSPVPIVEEVSDNINKRGGGLWAERTLQWTEMFDCMLSALSQTVALSFQTVKTMKSILSSQAVQKHPVV